MLENYQTKPLHLATRTMFPEMLKADLINGEFTDWKSHPQFMMSGASLHEFHNRLRAACDTLKQALDREVLNYAKGAILNWRLLAYGRQIIKVAHSHHRAEDQVYFPHYLSLYPRLSRPLALLDGDHRVLEQALDALQTALDTLDEKSSLADWEKVRDKAAHLQHVIHRHLDDEEEIVMPAILKRDS